MKWKFLVLGVFLMFTTTGVVLGAGSVTTPTYDGTSPTIREFRNHEGKLMRWLRWTWTSTAGTSTAAGGYVRHQTGKIDTCRAISSTADNNYDITIPRGSGGAGFDVLNGYGANIPNDDASPECEFTPLNDVGDFRKLLDDTISFSGTNLNSAGSASGTFDMVIELWDPAKP